MCGPGNRWGGGESEVEIGESSLISNRICYVQFSAVIIGKGIYPSLLLQLWIKYQSKLDFLAVIGNQSRLRETPSLKKNKNKNVCGPYSASHTSQPSIKSWNSQ